MILLWFLKVRHNLNSGDCLLCSQFVGPSTSDRFGMHPRKHVGETGSSVLTTGAGHRQGSPGPTRQPPVHGPFGRLDGPRINHAPSLYRMWEVVDAITERVDGLQ